MKFERLLPNHDSHNHTHLLDDVLNLGYFHCFLSLPGTSGLLVFDAVVVMAEVEDEVRGRYRRCFMFLLVSSVAVRAGFLF